MKCPTCVAAGQRSQVRVLRDEDPSPQAILQSLRDRDQFYDEDGRFHSHDTVGKRGRYACSNGHEFEATTRTTCLGCICARVEAAPAGGPEGGMR